MRPVAPRVGVVAHGELDEVELGELLSKEANA